jgi:hypothetical protein
MNRLELARAFVILGSLAWSVAACSGSSSRADGAVDARQAGDVTVDGGMADIVAGHDVVDVAVLADIVAGHDVVDVAVLADTISPVDASSGPDVADATSPIDVVIPADVVYPIDVVTPADGVDPIDVVIPMDVVSAIDVVTPVDDGRPADTIIPMDANRVDLVRSTDAGVPCVVDTDCMGTGLRCGYLITNACSATGTCVATPSGSPCWAITSMLGCGCDGTTVGWTGGCHPEFPDGYAPAAISHTGACP